eukprot:1195744-Rhodomonas_salina.1
MMRRNRQKAGRPLAHTQAVWPEFAWDRNTQCQHLTDSQARNRTLAAHSSEKSALSITTWEAPGQAALGSPTYPVL